MGKKFCNKASQNLLDQADVSTVIEYLEKAVNLKQLQIYQAVYLTYGKQALLLNMHSYNTPYLRTNYRLQMIEMTPKISNHYTTEFKIDYKIIS